MSRDLTYALDMLIAARRIREFTAEATRDAFVENVQLHSAVLHQLTVLGEAAKRTSQAFREEHQAIHWPSVTGLRNRIVHEYDKIDLDKVWGVVTREIPELIETLTTIVPPDVDGEESEAKED